MFMISCFTSLLHSVCSSLFTVNGYSLARQYPPHAQRRASFPAGVWERFDVSLIPRRPREDVWGRDYYNTMISDKKIDRTCSHIQLYIVFKIATFALWRASRWEETTALVTAGEMVVALAVLCCAASCYSCSGRTSSCRCETQVEQREKWCHLYIYII